MDQVTRPSCYRVTEQQFADWLTARGLQPPYDLTDRTCGYIVAQVMGVRRVLPTYEAVGREHVQRINRKAGHGASLGRPKGWKSALYGC